MSKLAGKKKRTVTKAEIRRKKRVAAFRAALDKGMSENEAMLKTGYDPSDERSSRFWREKYRKIKTWMKSEKMDPESKIRNIDEFKSLYMAIYADSGANPHVMRDMQYILKYRTAYRTAMAERQFIREVAKRQESAYLEEMKKYEVDLQSWKDKGSTLGDEPKKPERKAAPTFQELKGMTTHEFAEMYKEELREMYYDYKASGLTGKQAAQLISNEIYGSP